MQNYKPGKKCTKTPFYMVCNNLKHMNLVALLKLRVKIQEQAI